MSDGLDAITRHLNRVLTLQVRPLFLELDEALQLRQWRGDPARLGLAGLGSGSALAEHLPLLATANADHREPQAWRFVELNPGNVCHVHVLRLEDGWAVALLDARDDHQAQQSRQQIAHELLLLRDERERLLTELEQANRLKSDFIGRMSHEFRTPLASVIGYTDTLSELRPDDAEVQYHLSAVGRGARYLLNLVENLLDQAQIEIDALTPNPGACDLYELSDEVEQLLRPVAEQKSLSLAWWFDGDVPPRIWTDAMGLKQVLINLVGNAIKFTHNGGVNVEFEWSDDRLRVSVADTGPGIAEHDAQQVFEPFRQGGSGPHGKGAGLGLAISRTLVQALGGDIRLTNQSGAGARFDFDITARAIKGGRGIDVTALKGKVVVVADDDPDLLELLALYLRAAGCQAHTASDAKDTRQAAARLRPHAVLVDLNLGSDDGTALASALRRDGYSGRLVSLSAANVSDIGTSDGPFDAHWGKPISRARLLDGLAELLG